MFDIKSLNAAWLIRAGTNVAKSIAMFVKTSKNEKSLGGDLYTMTAQ